MNGYKMLGNIVIVIGACILCFAVIADLVLAIIGLPVWILGSKLIDASNSRYKRKRVDPK